jgi:hypothetical protein
MVFALHCRYSVNMSSLRFEWDAKKNAANRRKHGVSFEEARTAFLDENARVILSIPRMKSGSCSSG